MKLIFFVCETRSGIARSQLHRRTSAHQCTAQCSLVRISRRRSRRFVRIALQPGDLDRQGYDLFTPTRRATRQDHDNGPVSRGCSGCGQWSEKDARTGPLRFARCSQDVTDQTSPWASAGLGRVRKRAAACPTRSKRAISELVDGTKQGGCLSR